MRPPTNVDRPRYKTRTRVLAAVVLLILAFGSAYVFSLVQARGVTPPGFPPNWHCTNYGKPGTTVCRKDPPAFSFVNPFARK